MKLTKLATLTDEEFVEHLSAKQEATDEEIEAMLRIEALLMDVQFWKEQANTAKELHVTNFTDGTYKLEEVQ